MIEELFREWWSGIEALTDVLPANRLVLVTEIDEDAALPYVTFDFSDSTGLRTSSGEDRSTVMTFEIHAEDWPSARVIKNAFEAELLSAGGKWAGDSLTASNIRIEDSNYEQEPNQIWLWSLSLTMKVG